MITIISTTHRHNSMTLKLARIYQELLKEKGEESQIFSMEELPPDFVFRDFYGMAIEELQVLIDKYIKPVDKFVVIAPEYNGSYPGIFKVFIDAGDVYKYFAGKKAALLGIASGRAGNQRGIDHLTDIFHHMEMEVLSYKLPISRAREEISGEGKLMNESTQKVLLKQIDKLLKF